MGLWAVLMAWRPTLWPTFSSRPFARPWVEVGWALVAVVGVIAVGQLYANGIRLPATGALRPLLESVNQLAIFAPMLLLLPLRHHALETAWVRVDRVGLRIAIGVVLSILAIVAYGLVMRNDPGITTLLARTWHFANLHIAVQVLLEDLAIAILLVRLAAAVGARVAVAVVAGLFAAAHIPSLLTTGGTIDELVSLVRDAGLAAGVLLVALRGSDVWIVWPVHFAMDMMQFAMIGRQP